MKHFHITKSLGRLSFLCAAVLLSACSTPRSMKPVKLEKWVDESKRSALVSDQPSEYSDVFLKKYDLVAAFDRDPLKTLATIDESLCREPTREKLFVLSELCYLEGRRAGDLAVKRRLFISSARYAYLCLFHADAGPPLSEFDVRFQLASEFYNKASAQVFWIRREDWKERLQSSATGPLVRGSISMVAGTNNVVDMADLDRSVLAVSYEIKDLSPHVRRQGVGLPFIGIRSGPLEVVPGQELKHPPVRLVPVYAAVCVPHFEGPICPADDQPARAVLETYDPVTTFNINLEGHNVPLEADFSGPLALILEQTSDIQGTLNMPTLLRGESLANRRGLYMFQPYEPGKIPVVFVHGLLSSPVTWLPMINTLISDTEVLEKFQIWAYFYPTGNPILQSATELRQSLLAVREQLDPAGQDPMLDRMVLVGHSMGGLVSRLMISTGKGEFLQNDRQISLDDLDKVDMPDDQREYLKGALRFDPVESIDRVIFMATPHRGARMAETMVGRIGRALISLPKYLVERVGDGFEALGLKKADLPTGIDNLRIESNFMKSLAQLPMDPGVTFHSIIGNEKQAGVAGGTDGVVAYESSHLDGAKTETIYKSSHNVQKHPLAIQEVRSILFEHADEVTRRP